MCCFEYPFATMILTNTVWDFHYHLPPSIHIQDLEELVHYLQDLQEVWEQEGLEGQEELVELEGQEELGTRVGMDLLLLPDHHHLEERLQVL